VRPLLVILGIILIEGAIFYAGLVVGRAGRKRAVQNMDLTYGTLVRAAKDAVASHGQPHHALAIHNLDSELHTVRSLER